MNHGILTLALAAVACALPTPMLPDRSEREEVMKLSHRKSARSMVVLHENHEDQEYDVEPVCSGKLTVISTATYKAGNLTDEKMHRVFTPILDAVKEEPGTLRYSWYREGDQTSSIEVFKDQASFILHSANLFGAPHLSAEFKFTSFAFYTQEAPSPAMAHVLDQLKMIAGGSVKYHLGKEFGFERC